MHAEEAIWTLEDEGSLLDIVLPKADYKKKEIVWEALFADKRYQPDPKTMLEMRKKLDLEMFQMEVSNFICKHIFYFEKRLRGRRRLITFCCLMLNSWC